MRTQHNAYDFLGCPQALGNSKTGVRLNFHSSSERPPEIFMTCTACRTTIQWRLHETSIAVTRFNKPSDALKHLVEHQLAGHPVNRQLYNDIHKWLTYHGKDEFGKVSR